MHSPIRPVRPGDPVSAAKFNEVVDALNVAGNLHGAYPIEVRRDAAGVSISLASQGKLWLFELQTVPDPVPETSDGVAYYLATRIRLTGSDEYTAQSPQDVRLYDPITAGQASRRLATGNRVLAFFNADTGRWEIVRDPKGGGTTPVRFRLTASLALGGSAAAVILNWDPGSSSYVDGAAITVQDFSTPGRWSSPNGGEGMAVKLADKAEYEILWVEHSMMFAYATSTTNMSGGSCSATITPGWQGAAIEPGAATIYDGQGLYTGSTAGDKFVVAFDDRTGQRKYRIIDGPKPGTLSKWAYATADHTLAGTSKSKNHFVVCQACDDADGANPAGPTFNVYLPSLSSATDPNVEQGEVLEYATDANGKRVARGGGWLDDARGMIKKWSGSAATIPHGWSLCNGGSGTPDLSGRFVVGVGSDSNFDGQNHAITQGSTGGNKTHTHDPLLHLQLGDDDLRTDAQNLTIEPVNSVVAYADGPVVVSGFAEGATSTGTTGTAGVVVSGSATGTTEPSVTTAAEITVYGSASGYTETGVTGNAQVVIQAEGSTPFTISLTGDTESATTGLTGSNVTVSDHGDHRHEVEITSFGGTFDMGTVITSSLTGWTGPIVSLGGGNQLTHTVTINDPGHIHHIDLGTLEIDPGEVRFVENAPGHSHTIPSLSVTIPAISLSGGSHAHLIPSLFVYIPTITLSGGEHSHTIPSLSVYCPQVTLYEQQPLHTHTIPGATLAAALRINPNPHQHTFFLDDHAFPAKNHIPPYYALCYIMRTS